MATPPDKTPATATIRSALVVCAIASALPFLFVRYVPFTDLPEHVAAIATLARLLPGGGGDPDYVVSFGESQYLLYDLVAAVVARAVGDAVVANRIVLALLAVAWPFAFRRLLRAMGRDERLALFAPTLFWNRSLTIGFLPFVGSVPLSLVTLAAVLDHLDRPSWRRGLGLAALGVLLFYAHVSTYVLVCAAGGVFVVARSGRDVRRAAHALSPLIPSCVCAVAWWRAGSLDRGGGHAALTSRISSGAAIDAAPIWAFDIWRGHADELCAVVWWSAFALLMSDGLRRKPDAASLKRDAFALVPLACTLLIYWLTPFHVGPAGYLDVRLAPLLALFAVVLVRPATEHIARIGFAAAALVALGTAASATYEMRRIEREMVSDLDTLLGTMRPGTRLASLNFESRSAHAYFWPYVFVGSYHRQKPGTIAAYSFAELPHWPIHYAPGHAPPKHTEFWTYHPCEYRYRADGAYYDYVLVQGRFDPFAAAHPGPEMKRVAAAGAFTLYAKGEGASEMLPDAPDRPVCRRRQAGATGAPGAKEIEP